MPLCIFRGNGPRRAVFAGLSSVPAGKPDPRAAAGEHGEDFPRTTLDNPSFFLPSSSRRSRIECYILTLSPFPTVCSQQVPPFVYARYSHKGGDTFLQLRREPHFHAPVTFFLIPLDTPPLLFVVNTHLPRRSLVSDTINCVSSLDRHVLWIIGFTYLRSQKSPPAGLMRDVRLIIPADRTVDPVRALW